MGREARVYPDLCGVRCGPGERLEVPLPLLQERRRSVYIVISVFPIPRHLQGKRRSRINLESPLLFDPMLRPTLITCVITYNGLKRTYLNFKKMLLNVYSLMQITHLCKHDPKFHINSTRRESLLSLYQHGLILMRR